MDYVIGSVAALISGNVTPNRPKLVRRALTPTKHQASPNVTPKSEFVDDRSIFLSPTQQKKKAVVKKSPKRIFQNPDLDGTEDFEADSSLLSPKAEKVKKHLKQELDADDMVKNISKSPSKKLDKSLDKVSPEKKSKTVDNSQVGNSTPKKKKRANSDSNVTESGIINENTNSNSLESSNITESNVKNPRKKQRKSAADTQTEDVETAHTHNPDQETSKTNNTSDGTNTTQPINQEIKKNKKRKKNKKSQIINADTPVENKENTQNQLEPQNPNKKKKNNRKNKTKKAEQPSEQKSTTENKPQETKNMEVDNQSESDSEEIKSRNVPNPNAITEKESDSEHDSDDEIESENEQENEKILTNENEPQQSSDEEEQEPSTKKKKQTNQNEKNVVMTEEEVKRTLFVGNVPFSSKCKKEIKKIFSKYGQIVTIRIRTIPVKDARVTPKLAIIKNELHPERTTVNVYVKFADPVSVSKALAENNTILNGNHLRVTASESTGAEHDPRCAVFVGNLPFAVEDDTLRSKFENCGEITSVRIIRDKKTNAGKGFGYVNFANKDGVELALALSEEDLTIKNRILRVKRCTQQKPGGGKPGGGKWNNQEQGGGNRGNQGQAGKWGGQGPGGGYRGGHGQGGQWGGQGQGGQWGGQGQGGGNRGGQSQRGKRGGQGQGAGIRSNQNQGGKWGGQGQSDGYRGDQGQGGKWGNQGQGREEGAARRLMNKRKPQEGVGEGPPNKKQRNMDQPNKEKKPRKEFVGMTAEKKKKPKFNKGQKKKKALSEILTKKS